MKVMIATDGSPVAIEAARRSLGLLHPEARIELVTVVAARQEPDEDAGGFEGPLLTEDQADEEWREAVAAGRAALSRTLDALDAAVDEAKVVPSDGSVDQALVELVQAEGIDLLVLGAHERGWFDRFLHGATDQRLLHHLPCPLLVVGPTR